MKYKIAWLIIAAYIAQGVSNLEGATPSRPKKVAPKKPAAKKPAPKKPAAKKPAAKKPAKPKPTQEELDIERALALSLQEQEQQETKEEESLAVKKIKVLKQKGADCGFHALKNAQIVFQCFNKKLPLDSCQAALLSEDPAMAFNLPEMKDVLKKAGKKEEWLDADEINFLAKNSLKLNPDDYTVIDNIKELKPITSINDPGARILPATFGKALYRFKYYPNAEHAFVVGSMEQRLGTKKKGHWIAIVAVKRAGNITYYVMDSIAPGVKKNNPMVTSLINLLEQSNPAVFTIVSLPTDLVEIGKDVEAGNIDDALSKITIIIDALKDTKSTLMPAYKRQLDESLQIIILTGNAEQKKQAEALRKEVAGI
jgi:hypothetical protein